MINPDAYSDRTFTLRTYNCLHFLRDVWLDYAGVDLGDLTPKKLTLSEARMGLDKELERLLGSILEEVREPEDPCVVLMTAQYDLPHVGTWTNGRLLHLSKENKVVVHEPIPEHLRDGVRYFRVIHGRREEKEETTGTKDRTAGNAG